MSLWFSTNSRSCSWVSCVSTASCAPRLRARSENSIPATSQMVSRRDSVNSFCENMRFTLASLMPRRSATVA